ncbi:MAG: MASE4 domain-containing protein [Pseudomonadota bacterium]
MPRTDANVSDEQHFVLSNLPPTQAQKRLAAGIVLALALALYAFSGPFGGIQLPGVPSFIAVYTTAMFVIDFITAILLYTQFSILRSRSILLIASGYLFTALLIVPYVLAFPGVWATDGVIGDLQTSAHLYVLWHCAFPLFVVGYALTKDDPAGPLTQVKVSAAILASVAWTLAAAVVVVIICLGTDNVLPRIMLDETRITPNWPWIVCAPIALCCCIALAVLWLRRRSILDLFLMVVLFSYLIELPPHHFPFRYSSGWYGVRVTSLLSSTIVLAVLLHEITALYGGLLNAVQRQRRERAARLMTGDAVAASIAHEVRQPLTAMITTADAGLRFLDRDAPSLDKAKEAFRRIVADGHRAGDVIGSIRANFKSDVRDRITFDLNELIEEALSLGHGDLQKHRIEVHAEPNRMLPPIHGNRIQLQQVLLNLIMNAIDSMAMMDGQRNLKVRSELCDGNRVRVSVADTGTGIQAPDADRIFNPLFTSKPDGMGMGLSICRAIIEAHEGQLWFSPNEPSGAVFQFTLSAYDSPVSPG